jgi:hypothetical protein
MISHQETEKKPSISNRIKRSHVDDNVEVKNKKDNNTRGTITYLFVFLDRRRKYHRFVNAENIIDTTIMKYE